MSVCIILIISSYDKQTHTKAPALSTLTVISRGGGVTCLRTRNVCARKDLISKKISFQSLDTLISWINWDFPYHSKVNAKSIYSVAWMMRIGGVSYRATASSVELRTVKTTTCAPGTQIVSHVFPKIQVSRMVIQDPGCKNISDLFRYKTCQSESECCRVCGDPTAGRSLREMYEDYCQCLQLYGGGVHRVSWSKYFIVIAPF